MRPREPMQTTETNPAIKPYSIAVAPRLILKDIDCIREFHSFLHFKVNKLRKYTFKYYGLPIVQSKLLFECNLCAWRIYISEYMLVFLYHLCIKLVCTAAQVLGNTELLDPGFLFETFAVFGEPGPWRQWATQRLARLTEDNYLSMLVNVGSTRRMDTDAGLGQRSREGKGLRLRAWPLTRRQAGCNGVHQFGTDLIQGNDSPGHGCSRVG